MAALCVCDHARDAHTNGAGRCADVVSSSDDPEFGPYRCPCPAFEREAA